MESQYIIILPGPVNWGLGKIKHFPYFSKDHNSNLTKKAHDRQCTKPCLFTCQHNGTGRSATGWKESVRAKNLLCIKLQWNSFWSCKCAQQLSLFLPLWEHHCLFIYELFLRTLMETLTVFAVCKSVHTTAALTLLPVPKSPFMW